MSGLARIRGARRDEHRLRRHVGSFREIFFLGIDNKKRFLAVGKLECRSEPPCEAQPRRVALMLRLAAAEQSACLGMPPQRHPCKNTLTEQMKLETAVKGI